MMQKMVFCDGWITLIMKCVSTVTYSVVLNGVQGKEFKPSGGLRQGDPLSPYLFIICTQGFSDLITRAKSAAKIERSNLAITHLFFVDDSILFGEATEEGARAIKTVVTYYENVSGLVVNFDKSLIYFNKNTSFSNRERVGRIFGV
ncbi:reverse transcriptase [Gossypium australe]|uniref:Reverse transcriptase n=1 Tax=Gossypium australe TaxID=47621 RepID=A0A5B6X210_9ROSI|nr:reverse transcriptase [Gossypium australe]